MSYLFRSISSVLLVWVGLSCTSTSEDVEYDIRHGTIDYPFASRTEPLGQNGPSDKFVIRSTVGQTEYTIEIPGAARDYDIEVPIADMKRLGARDQTGATANSDIAQPYTTDQELKRAMPKLPEPDDRAMVEGAFGLGEAGGPTQSPSYTFKISKINQLYKERKFEYALIEINNLLTYYPSAVRLYKMKGTILMKLRNYPLAQNAWARGLELAPQDTALRRGLESLNQRIQNQKSSVPVQDALLNANDATIQPAVSTPTAPAGALPPSAVPPPNLPTSSTAPELPTL